jgi:hypothetical protein
MSKRTTFACIIALLATAVVTGGAVSVAAGADTESSGNQLVGTWQVTVTRPAPCRRCTRCRSSRMTAA